MLNLAADMVSYLNSATELPCTHVIIDRNTIRYNSGGYSSRYALRTQCIQFNTANVINLASLLTAEQLKSIGK